MQLRHSCYKAMELARWPSRVVRVISRAVRPRAWRLDGAADGRHARLTLLYAGPAVHLPYLRHLAYPQGCEETYLGKCWRGELPALARESNGALLALGTFRSSGEPLMAQSLFLPAWITGDVGAADYASFDSVKTDCRRVRRNRLRYTISESDEDFADFWKNMYVPSVRKRFGAAALVHARAAVRHRYAPCELLRVWRGDEPVGGGVLIRPGGEATIWVVGVRDGDDDHVTAGVMGAVWSFGVEHFRRLGFERVNLGWSRPVLGDGVLEFKTKRGLELKRSSPNGYVLAPTAPSEGLHAFLRRTSWVDTSPGGLIARVFVDADDHRADDVAAFAARHRLRGLSRVEICRLPGT